MSANDPKQTSFAAFAVEKIGYRKATTLEVAELSTIGFLSAPVRAGAFFVRPPVVLRAVVPESEWRS